MFGPCFVIQHSVSFLVLQYTLLRKRERAGCFTLVLYLLSCGCWFSSLPHGGVGWSVVCGISSSYSLIFCSLYDHCVCFFSHQSCGQTQARRHVMLDK